jgi:hypothetical protein
MTIFLPLSNVRGTANLSPIKKKNNDMTLRKQWKEVSNNQQKKSEFHDTKKKELKKEEVDMTCLRYAAYLLSLSSQLPALIHVHTSHYLDHFSVCPPHIPFLFLKSIEFKVFVSFFYSSIHCPSRMMVKRQCSRLKRDMITVGYFSKFGGVECEEIRGCLCR